MKKKIIVDRSQHVEFVTKSGNPSNFKALLAVIREAGLKGIFDTQGLQEIAANLGFYKARQLSVFRTPRKSTVRRELGEAKRVTEELQERLAKLSPYMRHGLGIVQGTTPPIEVELNQLIQVLTMEIAQLFSVADFGRGKKENKARFCRDMYRIWKRYQPSTPGIVRSGSGARKARAEYSGPLLDLCDVLLKFEGLAAGSRRSLGEQLFKARRAIEPKELSENKTARGARHEGSLAISPLLRGWKRPS